MGLDPIVRRSVLDYLKERVRQGLTIFFTTHILEEAEYLCNRIAVINWQKTTPKNARHVATTTDYVLVYAKDKESGDILAFLVLGLLGAFVHDLMRFSTEYAKRWGDAVLTTRIGLSYTDPTASCSLVGPDTYREFIKPYHKELVDYFKAKKVGTTIHICGTTHQIHEDLVDVGFVAITIDLDQQADPALKVDQLDKLVTLGNQRNVVAVGNVDATIFERATRAEIEAEVRRCIDTVGRRSRFVLSTSCELPPRANPDCVKWFMDAAREYGRWERILAP